MPRYSVQDRTVLITGASSGIGAASAQALHNRGANVVLVGRDQDRLSRLAVALGPRRTLPLSVDVTDRDALADAVARTVDRFGSLDVLFANAGISADPPATIATIDPDDFERIVETNLLGVWRTVRAALPHVIAARGHVLITSSVYAYVNGVTNAAYAASKAGTEQFTRALRTELAIHGATAGVLYPGWVDTPMAACAFGGHGIATQMRLAVLPRSLRTAITPESVARRVVTGIEDRAAGITAPRRWTPVSALRGIIGPLTDRGLSRHTTLQTLLRRLEGASTGRTSRPESSQEEVGAAPQQP